MEIKKQKFEQIVAGKDINELIEKFKLVNISYERLFPNTNQRAALERLMLKVGFEKLSKAIEIIAQTNGMPFAPDIRTPIELEAKWSKWVDFLWKEKKKKEFKGKEILGL